MTDPISNERLAEEALAAFKDWTKVHPAEWNLSAIVVNGRFSRFSDPDTDTAWLGFEAAWNRRQSAALSSEAHNGREVE